MREGSRTEPAASAALLARVDHIVYATPDLNRGIDDLEKLLGARRDDNRPAKVFDYRFCCVKLCLRPFVRSGKPVAHA
jgi:catechol 2,3-dioxygenase-like lactoylglutathione lyase family enzyme